MDVRYCAWAMTAERITQETIERVRSAEEVDRLTEASRSYEDLRFAGAATKTLQKRFSSSTGAYSTADFPQSSALFSGTQMRICLAAKTNVLCRITLTILHADRVTF